MWDMYWLVKLDDIRGAMIAITIVGAIALSFADCFVFDITPQFKKTWFMVLAMWVIVLPVAILLPSTKQMAAIIIVPKIANAINENEQLKKLPSKIVDLADSWITELKPKENK